eukprot:7600866-Pyramimonas_sp.AAC.1
MQCFSARGFERPARSCEPSSSWPRFWSAPDGWSMRVLNGFSLRQVFSSTLVTGDPDSSDRTKISPIG